MRWLLFACALAACGHSKPSGPAWPAPSTTAEDGGESIEPRATSTVATALEKADEPDVAKKDEPAKADEKKPEAAAEKPAEKPAEKTPEDLIMSEELIIEIDD